MKPARENIVITRDLFFFFNDTATTEICTLSLHDAVPIWGLRQSGTGTDRADDPGAARAHPSRHLDRQVELQPAVPVRPVEPECRFDHVLERGAGAGSPAVPRLGAPRRFLRLRARAGPLDAGVLPARRRACGRPAWGAADARIRAPRAPADGGRSMGRLRELRRRRVL